MNCKKCGAPLVPGQTICSTCETVNYENDNQNINQNSYINGQYNQNFYQDNYINEQYVQNTNNDIQEEYEKPVIKKQNIFLRISSALAMIGGVVMLAMSISNTFIMSGINNFKLTNLLSILISGLFVFYAILLSNFNLGKHKLYDNKVVFVVFLIINGAAALIYNIYFVILILSIIGLIISLKKEKE